MPSTSASSTIMLFNLQHFDDISLLDWYRISQLRVSVFVVEQKCAYQEFDGKDIDSYHLTAWLDTELVGYARLVPPGISHAKLPSIGRVVIHPDYRRLGYGKVLVQQALQASGQLYPDMDIWISAQSHLTSFYGSFGFEPVGNPYMEDGIPHQGMQLRKRLYDELQPAN